MPSSKRDNQERRGGGGGGGGIAFLLLEMLHRKFRVSVSEVVKVCLSNAFDNLRSNGREVGSGCDEIWVKVAEISLSSLREEERSRVTLMAPCTDWQLASLLLLHQFHMFVNGTVHRLAASQPTATTSVSYVC